MVYIDFERLHCETDILNTKVTYNQACTISTIHTNTYIVNKYFSTAKYLNNTDQKTRKSDQIKFKS